MLQTIMRIKNMRHSRILRAYMRVRVSIHVHKGDAPLFKCYLQLNAGHWPVKLRLSTLLHFIKEKNLPN
jgi:hypothetical protein